MTTKKQLIVRKYMELTCFLKTCLGENIDLFPPVDEIDVVDLIFYVNMFFETQGSYREGVNELMKMKNVNVDQETYEKMFPVVESFLVFLRDLK